MSVVTAVVGRFDAAEGLGDLVLDDGRRIGFHATQLRDGSRRIEEGTCVVARVVAGHAGKLEAVDITLLAR